MAWNRSKAGVFGPSGSAAQKLAVDSIKNIANIRIGGSEQHGGPGAPDAELSEISGFLSAASAPVPVAEIAERLHWDSAKTADALVRGGESGVLTFSKVGDTTNVTLADP